MTQRRLENCTLTAIHGLRVGHATDLRGVTGCTVILCPAATAAAVDQRGGAPGSRETDLLKPARLVRHVNAILLTGGSAFGLAAADGVVAWLEERGQGFPTAAGPVPIVPAAVLFDLDVGDSGARPDARMGRRACAAASSQPVEQGSIGAGTGCRVGALFGPARATKGGIGSAAVRVAAGSGSRGFTVAALFAVNALGDVLDDTGRIVAGLRSTARSSRFVDTRTVLARALARRRSSFGHTVLGVVATDARLDREGLTHVAAQAHDGMARAIRPAHTLFDGDTVFALSTQTAPPAHPDVVAAVAAEVAATAIRNAVLFASSLGGVRALSQ